MARYVTKMCTGSGRARDCEWSSYARRVLVRCHPSFLASSQLRNRPTFTRIPRLRLSSRCLSVCLLSLCCFLFISGLTRLFLGWEGLEAARRRVNQKSFTKMHARFLIWQYVVQYCNSISASAAHQTQPIARSRKIQAEF